MATRNQDRVVVVPPSDEWPRKFAREKARLEKRLGAQALEIEHIGSTAVKGLPSKPVVDIAVRIRSLDSVADLVAPLEKEGYVYMGEYGLPGRHFFSKGSPREYHLHLVDDTSAHWELWIRFRNILRRNPTVRKKYVQLKQNLIEKYAGERRQYTRGKSAFINLILTSEDALS